MKHVNEARKHYDSGDGRGALQILENLLDLAPRNPEALRMKAKILDSWGHFEESYQTLLVLSQVPNPSEEVVQEIEQRATEEREAILFSELTSEGRWYYAFPGSQLWVSIAGLMGCAFFLISSSQVNFANANEVMAMALSFFFMVLLPSILLAVIQLTGIKRIMVGLAGLRVCTRFREQTYQWDQLKSAVIEFDPDPRVDFLRLKLFGHGESKEPLLNLDISRSKCVVRARRHFLKNIVTHVDNVCYISRPERYISRDIAPDGQSAVENSDSSVRPPRAG
jgi:hypothetical protein